jgi:hypothetical protein
MLGQYASTAGTLQSALGPSSGLGPEGLKYSSKVQQRPHRTARSPLSRCVLTSANEATNGYCAEFGTKRSQVQILSPRPVKHLVRRRFMSQTSSGTQGLRARLSNQRARKPPSAVPRG